MKPAPTVKESDLVRLRNEYEGLARKAEEKARQPGQSSALLRGQASAYRGVAADINDLIRGKGHPSARRG